MFGNTYTGKFLLLNSENKSPGLLGVAGAQGLLEVDFIVCHIARLNISM